MSIKRMVVHNVCIEDKPGSLYSLLSNAASVGVDMHCVMACSKGEGKGCVCLGAKDSAALGSFLKGAGIESTEMAGFSLGGKDKVGAVADILAGLSEAGINGVAAAATVCEDEYHFGIIVAAADGDAAEKALTGQLVSGV